MLLLLLLLLLLKGGRNSPQGNDRRPCCEGRKLRAEAGPHWVLWEPGQLEGLQQRWACFRRSGSGCL